MPRAGLAGYVVQRVQTLLKREVRNFIPGVVTEIANPTTFQTELSAVY